MCFSEEDSCNDGVSLKKSQMHLNSSSDFLQQNEALEVLVEGEETHFLLIYGCFPHDRLGCGKAEILQPLLSQLSYRT